MENGKGKTHFRVISNKRSRAAALGGLAAAILLVGVIIVLIQQSGKETNLELYNGIGGTFKNTLADIDTPDPSIAYKDGFYYMTFTHNGADVMVMKSRTLDFREAERKVVWYPPVGTRYSQSIWAPEIQFVRGSWYIYFAADDGVNENHRMYALQALSDDPMGEYEFKGQVKDETDKWAIDGLTMELDGKLYFVWSGWEGDVNIQQNTYIAPMSDPLTISGPRVKIGEPDQEWERQGGPPYIHEGQAILQKDGRTFIAYSGAGSWTPFYSIGALALTKGADPLDPSSWMKLPGPLMTQNDAGSVYGPGHNTFAPSPDGTELWNIYHATSSPFDGWNNRKARAARVEWDDSGLPVLGEPAPLEEAIEAPSGSGLIRAEHGKADEKGGLLFAGFYSAVDTEAVILLQYRNRSGAEASASLAFSGSGETVAVALPATNGDETGYAYGIVPIRGGHHQELRVEVSAADVELMTVERPKAEAEHAALRGSAEAQDHPDYSGGRAVYVGAGEEAAVTFTNLNTPKSGKYQLRLSVAGLSEGETELEVAVGGKTEKVAVPAGGRGVIQVVTVDAELGSGGNTITIGSASAAVMLDRLEIARVPMPK
ncbi:alpha-N-arabinofuranosidase [Paenibacillus nanensis]|uniref:Alpha-N-arabinofuranosidase n=1 Tax=Paenibacillus nanensis TaxID=393251 RepID=A0A3A1VPT2_9BACL|nr:family 43 glycosylhydrolase [Paenibacillus nanensis]RIX59460.1 alpha-N-arabinofuranosidase [Paenibacillus nanensis]